MYGILKSNGVLPNPTTNNRTAANTIFQFSLIFGCRQQDLETSASLEQQLPPS